MQPPKEAKEEKKEESKEKEEIKADEDEKKEPAEKEAEKKEGAGGEEGEGEGEGEFEEGPPVHDFILGNFRDVGYTVDAQQAQQGIWGRGRAGRGGARRRRGRGGRRRRGRRRNRNRGGWNNQGFQQYGYGGYNQGFGNLQGTNFKWFNTGIPVYTDECDKDNLLLRNNLETQKLTLKLLETFEKDLKEKNALIERMEVKFEEDIELYKTSLLAQKDEFKKKINENAKRLREKIRTFKEIQKKKSTDNVHISNHTEFTRIVTQCYDVLEVIFSFLTVEDLFQRIMPTCVFFNNIVSQRLSLNLRINVMKFERYSIAEIVSGMEINELVITPTAQNFGFRQFAQRHFDKLLKLMEGNVDSLKKLDLVGLPLMFPHGPQVVGGAFGGGGFGGAGGGGFGGGGAGGGINNDTQSRRVSRFLDALGKLKNLEVLSVHLFSAKAEKIVEVADKLPKLHTLIASGSMAPNGSNNTQKLQTLTELVKRFGKQLRTFKLVDFFVRQRQPNNHVTMQNCAKPLEELRKAIFENLWNVEDLQIPFLLGKHEMTAKEIDFYMERKLRRLSLCITAEMNVFGHGGGFGGNNQRQPKNKKHEAFEKMLTMVKNGKVFDQFKVCIAPRLFMHTDIFEKILNIKNLHLIIYPNIGFVSADQPAPQQGGWGGAFGGNQAVRQFFDNLKVDEMDIEKVEIMTANTRDLAKLLMVSAKIRELWIVGIQAQQLLSVFEDYFSPMMMANGLRKIVFAVQIIQAQNFAGGFGAPPAPPGGNRSHLTSKHFFSHLKTIAGAPDTTLREICFVNENSSTYYQQNVFGGGLPMFYQSRIAREAATEEDLEAFFKAMEKGCLTNVEVDIRREGQVKKFFDDANFSQRIAEAVAKKKKK